MGDKTKENSEDISNKREERIYTAHNIFVAGVATIFTVAGVFAYFSFSNLKDELRSENGSV